MCQFSLEHIRNRRSRAGEELVFGRDFHGMASDSEPGVAVCLKKGTKVMVNIAKVHVVTMFIKSPVNYWDISVGRTIRPGRYIFTVGVCGKGGDFKRDTLEADGKVILMETLPRLTVCTVLNSKLLQLWEDKLAKLAERRARAAAKKAAAKASAELVRKLGLDKPIADDGANTDRELVS